MGQGVRNLGRANLPAEAVVFGVVVEPAGGGDNLDYRQSFLLDAVEIDGAGEFMLTGNGCFYQHGFSLGKSIADGFRQVVGFFHFGNAEAGASVGGLHE